MGSPSFVGEYLRGIGDHYLVYSLKRGFRVFTEDEVTLASLITFGFLVFLAAFGQHLTPYDYSDRHRGPDGELRRMEPPSSEHWLGTTETGYDVFSRLIYGAQPTLVTGFLGGALVVTIGLTIGVTAGYMGGIVDEFLMRFTDMAYGVPLIPAAIVMVAYFGVGFWKSIGIIAILLWRGNARVFRSQVLQIKERPYVKSAENLGASRRHIVLKHILPNMGGMIILFFALGTGITILLSASLSFLGMMDPYIPSWGIMLRNAYRSGFMTDAWWWAFPPGLMIALTVLTLFLIGRGYEQIQDANEGM